MIKYNTPEELQERFETILQENEELKSKVFAQLKMAMEMNRADSLLRESYEYKRVSYRITLLKRIENILEQIFDGKKNLHEGLEAIHEELYPILSQGKSEFVDIPLKTSVDIETVSAAALYHQFGIDRNEFILE